MGLLFSLGDNVHAHNLDTRATSILFADDYLALMAQRASSNQPLVQLNDEFWIIVKTTPGPGTTTGVGGYQTFYVPPGAQVLDVAYVVPSVTDPSGFSPIPMKGQSPIAIGDGPAGTKTTPELVGFTLPGVNGLGYKTNPVSASGTHLGTVAGVYADTGIFYSTNPATALNSYGAPTNAAMINNSGDQAGEYYAANVVNAQALGTLGVMTLWDSWQLRAFGRKDVAPIIDYVDGRGNAPWGLANAVAGPQSGYAWDFNYNTFTATVGTTAAKIQAAIGIGPWNRIQYPGSQISQDTPGLISTLIGNVGVDASLIGLPPSSLSSITNITAIRYAIGQLELGRPEISAVKVRINELPQNLNCYKMYADAFGGDAGGTDSGKDHIWRYFDPTVVGLEPCVFLMKSVSKNLVAPGETFYYTITFVNNGAMTLTNIVITDTLPAGLTHVGAVPAPTVSASPNFSWSLGSVLPGSVNVITQYVKASGAGTLYNTVSATTGTNIIGTAQQSVEVGTRAILIKSKSVTPANTAPGQTVQYTMLVTNVGTGPNGTPLIAREFLPPGFTYVGLVGATLNGGAIGNPVITVVATNPAVPVFTVNQAIQPGSALSITFTALVGPGVTPGTYYNQFEIQYEGKRQPPIPEAPVVVGGARIGDYVYFDWNGNGTTNAGESGIAGVVMGLYDSTGTTLLRSTTTDVSGLYYFTGLNPSTYVVRVDSGVPAGFTISADPDAVTNGIHSVTLTNDQQYLLADFGYKPASTGSIGDTVFADNNNNGVFNVGDVGITNVTVGLYVDSNNDGIYTAGLDAFIRQTNTTTNGFYQFTGLSTNFTYFVVAVDGVSSAVDDYFANPYATTTGNPVMVTPANFASSGGNWTQADIGYFGIEPAAISGKAYRDENADSAYNGSDAPIPVITINLYTDANGNGVFDAGDTLYRTSATEAFGNYSFTNLPPGNYIVRVDSTDPDVPGGYFPSLTTRAVTGLASGQTSANNDFPFITILNKAVDKASATNGEVITYTVTASYPGCESFENLKISDPVPAGVNVAATNIGNGGTIGAYIPLPAVPGVEIISGNLTTNEYSSAADAHIRGGGNAGNNFGAATLMDLQSDRRVLVRFPMTNIPATAVIESALLRLHHGGANVTALDVDAYRVRTNWIEGVQNGTASTTSVTWNVTGFSSWSTAGGTWFDAAGTAEGSSAYDTVSVSANGAYEWDITQMAEEWQAGASNFGVILNATINNTKQFASRENATATNRPVLSVVYTPITYYSNSLSVSSNTAAIGQTVQVTMRVTASTNLNNVYPGALTLLGGTGTIGSPSPAGPVNLIAGVTTSFTWNVTVNSAGIYTFSAAASNTSYRFPTASSPSMLVSAGGTTNVITWNIGSNTPGIPGEITISGYPKGIYGFKGGTTTNFGRYNLSGANAGSWTELRGEIGNVGAGGSLVAFTNGTIYSLRGGAGQLFDLYDINGNVWSNRANTGANVGAGAGLVYLPSNTTQYLYATLGGNNTGFRRYSIAANTWSAMAATPAAIGNKNGGGLAVNGQYIYALRGNNGATFYRYAYTNNTWATMANAPANVQNGGALVGLGDFVYGLRGNGTTAFWRYSIVSNSWTVMASTPIATRIGAALTTDGTNIFAFAGNSTTNFMRYNVAANTWTTLSAPAFGAVAAGGALAYEGGVLQQGYAGTMSACPTLVRSGTTVTVSMQLFSSQALTNVRPSALSVIASNGASATFVSGPVPTVTNIAASQTVSYAWTYTINSGTNPGHVIFRANATGFVSGVGTPAIFATNQANSVMTIPPLTFRATVQSNASVGVVRNTAFMGETGSTIPGIASPTVETALSASIGDFVWIDLDGDGVQDVGEPGLGGVTVCATAGTNVFCDTTLPDGSYRIYGLFSNTWTVTVNTNTFPAGYLPTTPTTLSVALTNNQFYLNADYGVEPPATGVIGDYLWIDADNDGVQDSGELPLTNITVSLQKFIGGVWTPISTKVTGTNGLYSFSGLTAGDYRVIVDTNSIVYSPYDGGTAIGASMRPTYDLDGTNTPHIANVTLATSSTTNNLVDFGYNWSGFIGDYVWYDDNLSGLPDPGEEPIFNARVQLYFDANNNGILDVVNGDYEITRVFTGTNGYYLIENLPPGSYIVDVYEDSITTNGVRDIVPTTADNIFINLGPGQGVLYADFGYYLGARVDGTVFWDVNHNGVLEGEPGLSNVIVTLTGTDLNNNPVTLVTTTDASGAYYFVMPEGNYTVYYDYTGLIAQYPSLTDQTTVTSVTFFAQAGEDGLRVLDFGVDNPGRIGDTIYGDSNGNGSQNPGEPGLANVTVLLYLDANGDGIIDGGDTFLNSQVTDLNGYYQFVGLPDSTGMQKYLVQVFTNSLPSGYQSKPSGYPPGANTNLSTYATTLTGGASIQIVDFGYPLPPGVYYSVSGTVWDDGGYGGGTKTNAVKDGTEYGFTNILLVITVDTNNDNIVDSSYNVYTDTNGFYSLSGIPSNSTVKITVSESTLPNSSYQITPGMTNSLTVSNISANVTNRNFGYYANYGSVAGTVVIGDGDGLAENGEPPVSGVEVFLTWAGPDGIPGNGDDVTVSTFTDTLGNYIFNAATITNGLLDNGLPPGLYQITKSDPAGLTSLADRDLGNPNSISISLAVGENKVDQDFELTPPLVLGDRVWLDENSDGIQDAGEAGIANVVVRLYDVSGLYLLAETVTDSEGSYLFTGLAPGSYIVRVDASSMASGLSANPTFDYDGIGTVHGTAVILAPGMNNFNADFGYNWSTTTDVDNGTGTGAIGDRIWIDADGDGRQDPGEPGLGGVLVELYYDSNGDGAIDSLYAGTTSAADGSYFFDGLPAGIYRAVVNGGAPVAGYVLSGDPDGTLDNRTTSPIVLAPGDVYVNADFGYQPAASSSLSGTVYFDANANSNINAGAGEYGIRSVTVALLDSNGVVIATTTTDANGNYEFTGLPAGTFTVWVNDTANLLGRLSQTQDPDATVNGRTTVAVNGTGTYPGNDFGYTPAGNVSGKGVIGDTVFLDRNNNGQVDIGEGMQGVIVNLYDGTGTNLLYSTTTDANGTYYFGNLPDDSYVVEVNTGTLPNGGVGLSNTVDPDGGSDSSSAVTISGGNVNLDQDFGYTGDNNNVITGTIWNDRNANGTVDGDEPGRFAGITVFLRDTNGNVIASTETDALGQYQFFFLPDGSYIVDVVDTLNYLEGFWHSLGIPDTYGESQNDPYAIVLNGGNSYYVDFGYYIDPASLGDFVWHDINQDGVQDPGEPGIPGVVVQLTIVYPDGTTNLLITVTDVNGFYSFDYLLLDEDHDGVGGGEPVYTISIPSLPGTASPQDQASEDLDSDNPAGETADAIQGANNSTYDFGFYNLMVYDISGTTYYDDDRTGTFSGGDLIQTGVTVSLFFDLNNDGVADPGEFLDSTVVDDFGNYSFTGLPNGNYIVVSTPPANYSSITDVDGNANGRNLIEVAVNGADVTGRDFLLGDQFLINGYVYDDDGFNVAGNGLFDADAPIQAVQVRLYRDLNTNGIADPAEFVTNTFTDVDGFYQFDDLPPGNYLIVLVPPAGSTPVLDEDGDINGNGYARIAVTVLADDVLNQRFLVDNASVVSAIGDRAWFDFNGNGLQDTTTNETTRAITNLTVSLLNTNGDVVATTITDTDGNYLFSFIPAGTYVVQFDLTTITSNGNVRLTSGKQGTNDVIDSDAVYGNVGGMAYTDPIVFAGNTTNLNVDIGIAYIIIKTRASVADVSGEWSNGQGLVVWQTSSEWGTAGFKVYRVDPETGRETLLSDSIIPSVFDANGATYQQVDPAVALGDEGSYRIEEIELSGEVVDMGTHAVVFAETVRKSSRKAASRTAPQKSVAPINTVAGPSDCLKIGFRKDGIYAVSFADIANGMGITAAEVEALAIAGELVVSAQTNLVAYHADAANDRILFFGQALDDFYTRDNVYMIKRGTGLLMSRRDPGANSGPQVFAVNNHYEEDHYIFDALTTPVDDLFYWDFIVSGNTNTGTRNFPVDLTGFAGGDVAMTVRLIGMSFTTNQPDHVAEILFNGSLLSTVSITGQDELETAITVPGALVTAGTNTVTIRGTRPASSGSFFALDWIEASFARTLTPAGETLLFSAGGETSVSASLFSQPVVMSISAPAAPVLIAEMDGTIPGGTWSVANENERFAVVESSTVVSLAPKTAVCDAWFMSSSNKVDYLIVVASSMKAAAQELADYRAGQGLRVGIAVFEEVCDLFRGGVTTPEAVSDLVKYASANWSSAPWMVLLAGNGHYDFLGAFSTEANPLPPLLYRSSRGIFSADGLFTDLDGDTAPDLAIGRLPAMDAGQLTTMITKIKAHEAQFDAAWQKNMTLAADTREAVGPYGNPADFAADSENLAAVAGGEMNLSRIYRDTMTVANARTQLLARFHAGAGVIHYTGHGNPSIMGRTSSTAMMRDTDVNAMTNSRQPLLVSLSCLLGRFEAPGNNSIGELMLRRANGGSVAVWSPSGLSSHNNAMQLGEAFYQKFLDEGCNTLGLAVLRARQALVSFGAAEETLATYNLLGDPAMKLGSVPGSSADEQGFMQWRWQNFSPSDLSNASVSGSSGTGNAAGVENLLLYALGGDTGTTELPIGLNLVGVGSDGNLVVDWIHRPSAVDVEYVLIYSDNLKQWVDNPPFLQHLSATPVPASVIETVRTRVLKPDATNVFIGVKYIQK